MSEHLTQKQLLDALFRSRENEKIPLFELCSHCHMAAYSRRIEELRADYDALTVAGVEDFLIVNYQKREDGVCKSWYAREPRSGRPRWQPRHGKPRSKPVEVSVRVTGQDSPWQRSRPQASSREARLEWFRKTFNPKPKVDPLPEPEQEWKLVP